MKYFRKCVAVGLILLLESIVLPEEITSSVKGLLARSLFETDLELLGNRNVSVDLIELLKKDVVFNERSSGDQTADQSYDSKFEFPHGFILPPLESNLFAFKTFHQTLIPLKEGNTPVLIKMVEWRGFNFLANCYEKTCEIFKGNSDLELNKEQSFSISKSITQVKFFSEQTKLFVVVVADITTVYRWEETYFDLVETLKTDSAKAVEIINIDDRTIMVFAQKKSSKVFSRIKNRSVLIQNLDCNAINAVNYNVDSHHGVQHFILMLSTEEMSNIYWWNGKQFSKWSELVNNNKPDTVFQSEIDSEPFIFISNKNVVSIYHAELTHMSLMRTMTLDGEVTSLKVENSKLVFLLSKPSGDRQILVISFLVSREEQNDEMVDESPIMCLKTGLETLKARRKLLDIFKAQKNNFITVGKQETIKNVTVVGKTIFNSVNINKVVINTENVVLQDTPVNMLKKFNVNEKKLLKLQKKVTQLQHEKKNITIQGVINVKQLYSHDLNVKSLNYENLIMDDYLSYNKVENKTKMRFDSIIVNKLSTTLLNNKSPGDLLKKNLPTQILTGDVNAMNIFADNVKFGEIATINGIKFDEIVAKEQTNIKGLKSFRSFMTEFLNSSQVNNLTSDRFIERVLPSHYFSNMSKNFHTDYLEINRLNVENINSMPWEEYINKTFYETSIKDTYEVTYLNTNKINGILVENLLNKNDNQTIASELYIKTLRANKLKFNNFNNGSLSQLIQAKEGSKILIERPVRITGNLNASTIHFDNPVQIGNSSLDINKLNMLAENGNFKNISLQEESNETARNNQDEIQNEFTDDTVHIKKIVIRGDLKIKKVLETKAINGYNLESTLEDILIIGRDNVLEMNNFTNIVFKNITLAKVNGEVLKRSENISTNTLSVPHVIFNYGNNSARQDNAFEKLKVIKNLDGKVNDVDFLEMSKEVLSKSKNDLVTGHFEIANINGQSISVLSINDVQLDSLIFSNKNEPQTIYSDLTLTELAAIENLTLSSPLFKCHIEKVKNMNFSEVLKFDYIEAVGDISWEKNNSDINSISYILSNAVIKSRNNSILEPVIFKKRVEIRHLETQHHINNIDISFIVKDAVLSSVQQQVINCKATLKNVTADIVNISSDLSVDSIGGVDIINLDKRLVKKSQSNTITGKKNIQNGLKCFRLIADTIHGTNFSNLVFLEDLMSETNRRVLPPTTFESLDVNYNMTIDYINDLNFNDFKNKIISISKDENITEAFVFDGNLQADKLDVSKINDLKLEDTVLCSGKNQTIKGKKHFHSSVVQLIGDIKAETVHGNDFMLLYKNSLKSGENATINNNVVFETDLIVKGNLNSEIINSCNIPKLYEMEQNFSPKYIESENRIRSKNEYIKIEPILKATKKEKIFKHLESFKTVDLKLENIQSTSTHQSFNKTINVEVYGMAFDACGVEAGCLCPRQYTLSFGAEDMEISYKGNRTYHYYPESLDVAVRVLTNSVSYKARCQANDTDEITEISYATGNDSFINLSTLRSGYLSDVKFFRLDESIYVILAFLYNGKGNESHTGKVSIFELQTSSGVLLEVDELLAEGAMVVDVVWASPSYILVVANLRSNETSSESVHSQVYYFNEKSNKFSMMKNIRTHGVMNLKAVRMGKESFIFVIQKNPWPLLAFKYSNENENFYFSEKLYRQAGFYSVNSLPLSDDPAKDLYMGVVFMDNKFIVLKYKHIEGLGEETTVRQENVQALQYFTWKSQPYLLAVSAAAPSYIYQIVVQNQ